MFLSWGFCSPYSKWNQSVERLRSLSENLKRIKSIINYHFRKFYSKFKKSIKWAIYLVNVQCYLANWILTGEKRMILMNTCQKYLTFPHKQLNWFVKMLRNKPRAIFLKNLSFVLYKLAKDVNKCFYTEWG